MTAFHELRNGWWASQPPQWVFDECQARWAQADRVAGNTRYLSNQPWVGYLGERGFERFLAENYRGEYVYHGGVDQLPDFELDGHTVALKTRHELSSDRPTRVYVPRDDWERGTETHFAFACWADPRRVLYILGGITRFSLDRHAERHRAGSVGWCRKDCLSLSVEHLTPPLPWLNGMSHATS